VEDKNMFLLFAGANYYPSGGMNDCKGVFHTKEEAETHLDHIKKENPYSYDWNHIQDTSELEYRPMDT
jgi:hypothetical protein